MTHRNQIEEILSERELMRHIPGKSDALLYALIRHLADALDELETKVALIDRYLQNQ